MRLLHTADWHLGTRLGGHDLTPALLRQVERVLAYCDEHAVEVLLVAGDVFEKKYGLADVTRSLAEMLRPRIEHGLHVILTPGNHDDRQHFRMMRALLGLDHDAASLGRVRIVEGAEVFSLCGVHFGVLPYPSHDLLLPNQPATGGEERWIATSANYAAAVRGWSEYLKRQAATAGQPAVFVAHVTVQGVTTPSGHEVNYNETLLLGRDDLPRDLAYTALGHIHQMQRLDHPVPSYYAGSIDRLDMGEWRDDKFVLLVDVPAVGDATVRELRLDVTPFLKLRVAAAELDTLAAMQPKLADAFAYLEVECGPGDDAIAVRRRVNVLCPRLLDLELTGSGVRLAAAGAPAQPRDFTATVLEFVQERFADDPDLPQLQAAAVSLIDEVSALPRFGEVDYATATG